MQNNWVKKTLTRLAPILGAGGVGVCPLCWAGSASLLTYLGLGALIPIWQWVIFGLFILAALGFTLDLKAHKNPNPLILLVVGGILLYLGRYVYGGAGFGGWQIWGPGALLIILAVFWNRRIFKELKSKSKSHLHFH